MLQNDRQVAMRSIGVNDPNEDACGAYCPDSGRCVLAVADGVGGRPDGEVASRLAVQTTLGLVRSDFHIPIDDIFYQVKKVFEDNEVNYPEMATTLTIARVSNLKFEVGHVGDSRAYHLRKFGIKSLTKDQTEGQYLLDQGVFTRKQIRRFPRRNSLTSAISSTMDYTLQKSVGELEINDKILLLSDGVSAVIPKKEIAALNSNSRSSEELLDRIEKRAEEVGLLDDFTLACYCAE